MVEKHAAIPRIVPHTVPTGIPAVSGRRHRGYLCAMTHCTSLALFCSALPLLGGAAVSGSADGTGVNTCSPWPVDSRRACGSFFPARTWVGLGSSLRSARRLLIPAQVLLNRIASPHRAVVEAQLDQRRVGSDGLRQALLTSLCEQVRRGMWRHYSLLPAPSSLPPAPYPLPPAPCSLLPAPNVLTCE